MNTKTLRGVFPTPKPVHNRNFIKENVRHIKEMQGFIEAGTSQRKLETQKSTKKLTKHTIPAKRVEKNEPKFTHRSVQTDDTEKAVKQANKRQIKTDNGQGDIVIDDLAADLQQSTLKSPSKPSKTNKSEQKVPSQPPATYQRGVVPKYLIDRREKELKVAENDPECPAGHILLPEDERKETLRVLRQNYADRIQELNGMPVRSDTLRMRKRKIEIEEELKKIDGGIKVFQRPKVFVKINA